MDRVWNRIYYYISFQENEIISKDVVLGDSSMWLVYCTVYRRFTPWVFSNVDNSFSTRLRNWFNLSRKFIVLMVGDYINTIKTTFIKSALIPNLHLSNYKFTSKQREAVSWQLLRYLRFGASLLLIFILDLFLYFMI